MQDETIKFEPDMAALLDEYTFEMFFSAENVFNRDLGREVLTRIVTLIESKRDEDYQPPAQKPLESNGVVSSTLFEGETVRSGSASSIIEEAMQEEDADVRRERIFALVIAANMEVQQPYAPVSDRLQKDPAAALEVGNELDRYFSFMANEQQSIMESLTSAAGQLGESKNDIKDQRCVVAIPVAGHQEYANIYNTLEQLARQDMPADQFEVVLSVNLPASHESEAIQEHEESLVSDLSLTLAEIERFKASHTDFALRYYTQAYRGSKPTIGNIRADLWATIGLDAHQRGLDHDVLMVSADADIVHLNKEYLRRLTETFEATGADMVTAGLRWQMAPGLAYDAPVNRYLRYQAFLDSTRDRNGTFLLTSDANTAISMATYFAIGGYDRRTKIGEMLNLTWKIRDYRNRNDGFDNYDPAKVVEAKAQGTWLKTHSRRLIRIMAMGYHPYEAWNPKLLAFGPDDVLRTEAMQVEAANSQAAQDWKKWIKSVTPEYTKNMSLAKKRRVLKMARKILGFEDLYS